MPLLNPFSLDFFTNYLNSSSTLFNLCVSWNINGWNIEKRDSVSLFNQKFLNQFVSAYKKLVIANIFLEITLLPLFITTIQFLFMQTLKSLV